MLVEKRVATLLLFAAIFAAVFGNEDVTFSFEKPVYNFTENEKNATIYVDKINGSIDEEITLFFFISIEGELRNQTFPFGPNNTKEAFIFNVRGDDDIALQPIEQYELFLHATDGNILFGPNNKTTLYITDDDELLIGLTTQKVTVMEGNNARLCVNFSTEFATNFNINVGHLRTNDYPAAVPNKDFFLTNLSIEAISTLHGSNNNLCFNVMVIQDEFAENEECFEVGVSLPDSVSSDLMVELDRGKDTAVVCIQDDDYVTFSFEKPVYNFTEDEKNATIYVDKINGSIDEEITLFFFISIEGELFNQTFPFGPNNTKEAFIFNVRGGDEIALQPIEQYELFLHATNGNILFGPNNKTILYITDDDGMSFTKRFSRGLKAKSR